MTINLTAKLGAYTKLGVDNELSLTSEAPVQNKVITENINEINSEISLIGDSIESINTDISSLQDNKQNITDNNLNTENKTISGAINELDDKVDSIEDNYVRKSALQNGGIKSTTKTQMFGGDFSVTTTQTETYLSPHALASVTGRLNKHNYYEIVCNDTTYTLPSELYFHYEGTGTKVYEYIGNVSLYTEDLIGITNPIRNEIPFCIISDLDNFSSIDVFTTIAGTYTFNVKKLIDTFESLPLELVSRTNYPLVSQSTNASSTSSTYANFSAVGPNRVENRGTIAIGHSNICDNEFAIAIGGKNHSTGKYGTAIGWNNSISNGGGSACAIGSSNSIQGTGAGCSFACGASNTISNNYSFACNTGNTVNAAGAHAEGTDNLIDNVGGWKDPAHNGAASHIEGNSNVIHGRMSHCEGEGNLAYGHHQHVEGTYNIADENDEFIHIVGNGAYKKIDETYVLERSNAYTLDWQGNGVYSGNVQAQDIIATNQFKLNNRIMVFNEDGLAVWYENGSGEITLTPSNVSGDGFIISGITLQPNEKRKLYWAKFEDTSLFTYGKFLNSQWHQTLLLNTDPLSVLIGPPGTFEEDDEYTICICDSEKSDVITYIGHYTIE